MKIWIDMENSPHALFFPPIIDRLKALGDEIVVTARDCSQTLPLLDMAGVPYRRVGTQPQGSKPVKAAAVMWRALRLAGMMRREGIHVAASHSSRSHVLAARLLGIPVVTLLDYEYAAMGVFTRFSEKMLIPQAIPLDRIQSRHGRPRVVHYPGFKEQVYARPQPPDAALIEEWQLTPDTVVAVVRPPAVRAHYHRAESDQVMTQILDTLSKTESPVRVILLPRYPEQHFELRATYPPPRFVIPQTPIPVNRLLSVADLVISGGGTMVREAVAMGIPAYSIFQSRMGAVDEALIRSGGLVHLKGKDAALDFRLEKRPEPTPVSNESLLEFLVDAVRSTGG